MATDDMIIKSGGRHADHAGCYVVNFRRPNSRVWHACLVAAYAARNDVYLRSLVNFMRWKVGAHGL